MLKNRFYRFNRWLDKRETLKFILMVVYVLIGFGSIQFGYLIFGTIMISILCFITISRVFIIDGKLKFDRSVYDIPSVGEIVVVKKDFYYDGSFRKFINTTDPSQRPNWWKVSKGTELVILNVEETNGDWKVRLIEPTINSQTRGDLHLYYLDTKDYWDTKANIRSKILSKIGI
jgi:hypothetical protein